MNSLGLPDPGDYNPGNWTQTPPTVALVAPPATTPAAVPPDVVLVSPYPPAQPAVDGVDVTESVYTPGA